MSLKHDHVADLLWQLSPEDRTHILAVLLERYDLSDDCRVYCCKSCKKTGSTVQDHPMTVKFWTCDDCCEDYCDDCAEEKIVKNPDSTYCKECVELDENSGNCFPCSSCRRNRPKNTEYHQCKKCINLLCEDCTGDEIVKSCKECHIFFCKVCGPTWIKNGKCVDCRKQGEMRKERQRKEKLEREAKIKEKKHVKMASKK